MGWQMTLTLALVGLAVVYLFWRANHAWRGMKCGCSGGCGCQKASGGGKSQRAIIAPEELVLRQRQPQVDH